MTIRSRVLTLMSLLLVTISAISVYFGVSLYSAVRDMDRADRLASAVLQGYKARAAHALKSAAGNVGVRRAHAISLNIEDDARSGDLAGGYGRLDQWDEALGAFLDAAMDWTGGETER